MKRFVQDHTKFLGQFRENFHSTGAILPISRFVGRALARYGAPGTEPQRILEAGPGTGVVTRQLARRMGPHDTLDVVELNTTFAEHLQASLDADAVFAEAKDRIRIINDRVENVPGQAVYDVIVSGLPLNNFAAEDVETILTRFAELLKPGGTLSFFQYIAVRRTRAVFARKAASRNRLDGIGRVLHRRLSAHEIRRDWIWPNVPPAWVHHLRFDPPHAGGDGNSA